MPAQAQTSHVRPRGPATVVPVIPLDLEEAEYCPQEVLEDLDREFELVKSLIAAGELRPVTTAEVAAKYGLKR